MEVVDVIAALGAVTSIVSVSTVTGRAFAFLHWMGEFESGVPRKLMLSSRWGVMHQMAQADDLS